MGPIDIIALIVISLIIGAAVAYIVKAKKSGKKCIGCPNGGSCKGGCSCGCPTDEGSGGCCGCSSHVENKKSEKDSNT